MKLQNTIIKNLKVKPKINPKYEIECITNKIKTYLKINDNIIALIIGISGGQDSTLTGKLCQIAIHKLRKEHINAKYQLIAVRLPYGQQSDEQDCKDAINFINPDNLLTIDIKNAVLSSEKSLKKAGIIISDHVKGNEKARERMKVQYSIASMKNGIVVGTQHASENVTGFFTKYGDGGSDINPIANLNKRQGRALLQELNCPPHLYLKDPTAGLEDTGPHKTDENILGIKYSDIDDYLEGKKIDKNISNIIESMFIKTKHKREFPML